MQQNDKAKAIAKDFSRFWVASLFCYHLFAKRESLFADFCISVFLDFFLFPCYIEARWRVVRGV